MKAAVLNADGIALIEVDEPTPTAHEMVVEVRACGLNRADLLITQGAFHGHTGGTGTRLGMEWSGTVAEIGTAVQGFAIGDRIMCSGVGGWAEFAVCDWRRASLIPADNMTFEQAASLPVALNTMHDALITNGHLQNGDSVMIQGASSGVGIIALQIAKKMGAGQTIASSTNPSRRARLSAIGADLVVDSRDPAWVNQVLEATGGKGVDLLVDQISGYVANQNMAATAVKGRIVNVGRLGGMKGEFNFDLHALRRINYIGVTFRTRTIEEVHAINLAMQADLWPLVEAGDIMMPEAQNFALDEVQEALEHMNDNKHFGKITLTVA
jgi:NADPH2:quinone reductase